MARTAQKSPCGSKPVNNPFPPLSVLTESCLDVCHLHLGILRTGCILRAAAMEPAGTSLVSLRASSTAGMNCSFSWRTPRTRVTRPPMAIKSGAKLVSKGCKTCRGTGGVECEGCKGTGKNKKNGNIFERWKCYDCQGFGMRKCPVCGKKGLTPEQAGER
uniref:Uncharacterized protein n=1 Tax=Avena sativa TaxID=4498 RepID=A0ACD5TY21_AVESA